MGQFRFLRLWWPFPLTMKEPNVTFTSRFSSAPRQWEQPRPAPPRVRRGARGAGHRLTTLAAAAALLVAAAAGPAAATHANETVFGAQAGFSSVNGCTFTEAFVVVSRTTSRATEGYVSIRRFDWCDGTDVTAVGYEPVPDGAFVIDRRLTSARFDATMTTTDGAQIDVHTTWTASGPVYRDHQHLARTEDGIRRIVNVGGSSRFAVATTTVTVAGITFAATSHDPLSTWMVQGHFVQVTVP